MSDQEQRDRPSFDVEYLAALDRRIKASDEKRKEWRPKLKISKHEILLVLERETQHGGEVIIAEYPYVHFDDGESDEPITVLVWHIMLSGLARPDEFVRGKENAIMRVVNIAIEELWERSTS